MSHFYGTVKGRADTAGTRRGTRQSGLQTVAASFNGAIYVRLEHDEATGRDFYTVIHGPWKGKGPIGDIIAHGELES